MEQKLILVSGFEQKRVDKGSSCWSVIAESFGIFWILLLYTLYLQSNKDI